MARLKVGDIEIDGTNVTIGGQRMGVSPPVAPTPMPSRDAPSGPAASADPSTGLHELPLSSGGLVIAGIAALIAGAAWMAVNGPWGAFLLPIGLGLTALGLLKHWADRRAKEERERRAAVELAPTVSELRRWLSEPDQSHTVEWLVSRSGLSERQVVQGLAELQRKGELMEDLSDASGEWFYYSVSVPRTLGARLKESERNEA